MSAQLGTKRVTQSSSHLAAADALFPAEELNGSSLAGGILKASLPLGVCGWGRGALFPVPPKKTNKQTKKPFWVLEFWLRSSESGTGKRDPFLQQRNLRSFTVIK